MPRSLNIKLVLFSLLAWIAVGCKKSTPQPSGGSNPPNQEECLDYVFNGGEVFDTYITTGVQYARPFFNPNNGDEFVYVRSGTGTYTELVKRKISTGQETILCNSLMIPSQPQWSKQGWILFSAINNAIWKVREDGSQLTQIIAGGASNFTPVLNYDGDKFIGNKIFDLDGAIIDSIQDQYGSISIGYVVSGNQDFKNGYYRYYDGSEPVQNFGYCKLNNNQSIDKLTSFSMNGGEAVAACRNNENLYYARYMNGLYQVNIASRQEEKIMECCQSRYVVSLSMSPNGKNIIFERVRGHQTTPGGMVIDEQSEIFLYNLITKKETKILWEE
ncbi:hypothetical protein [Fluviicola sp.]|jgi:Tol biopolymer transport system component|uniref:TolB family protein n=1 Tax=Fluviicola sp. TaxID=1917219 RepID=UPI002825DECC|nr:hypothetical protein [Fluviicola sp.]MDR0801585.1 hypothetical protein [Fluviicola sp.]